MAQHIRNRVATAGDDVELANERVTAPLGRSNAKTEVMASAASSDWGDSSRRDSDVVTGGRRPKIPTDAETYRAFRELCTQIIEELRGLWRFLKDDVVSDEGSEIVAEVESLIEKLYDCPFGQGESLKKVVVTIQSQVNHVQWERRHAEFLTDVFTYLRPRRLINDGTVAECCDLIKAHKLDLFRGVLS